MNTNLKKSTPLEKVLYSMGGLGGGAFCYTFISGFITMYYTNSLGLAAASIGTMMLIARLVDAASDIVFAWMVEKFPSKRMGKFRHWLLLAAFLLPLSVLICFNMPAGLSESGKTAYMYFSYIFASAVAYTIMSGSINALMSRISEDPKDIEKISVIYVLFTMVGVSVMYMLATHLLTKADPNMASQSSWTGTSILFAIISFVCLLLCVCVKEKVPLTVTDENTVEKTPFKEGLKVCMTTKYFWLLLFIFLFYQFSGGILSGASTYYAGYVVGDFNVITLTSIPGLVVQIICFLCVPLVTRKISKITLMKFSLILYAVIKFIPLIDPTNIPLYVVCTLLATATQAPSLSLIYTMLVDFIVYIASKTGLRAEGIAGIAVNIGTKVGIGLGSAMTGWLLAWGNFDGTAVVQSASAVKSIMAMGAVLPAAFMLLSAILMFFWDIDKHTPAPKKAE